MSHNDKIKVVFIGGYGRSGSTLLDLILGQVEGFFSVGELRHIWDRSFGENQLCGCGRPFRDCPFWKAVVKKAFGGFDNVELRMIKTLKHAVDRMRYVPYMLTPSLRPQKYQVRFSKYINILESLYKAIRDVSQSKFIIDSSKDPSYGFLLNAIPGVESYVIHLVRDSRAVAYSWQRKKRRPEIYWKEEYMPQYSSLKSALEWGIMNGMIQLLGHVAANRYILVRYEDVVEQPREAINIILSSLGVENVKLEFISDRTIHLGINHTVSGNPIRFQNGTIMVNPDSEWKYKMSRLNRVLVSGITWPLLLKYGYL